MKGLLYRALEMIWWIGNTHFR